MSDAVALQVVAERGDARQKFEAWGYHTEHQEVLRPGMDYRNGCLYMTFPIDRSETKTVGRGKASREIEVRSTSTIAVRSAHPKTGKPTFFPYDEDTIRGAGFRFPQTFTQGLESRWSMDSMIEYINESAPPVDARDLFDEIRRVYSAHVEYPEDTHYDLVSLFVMGTYLYRLFDRTGYLHFNGTRASGKSQNLRILYALGFNTVWSSNLSAAALFRQVAGNPGLLCIDEAESFESEKGQEIRSLLLSGYVEGGTVGRVERTADQTFQIVQYEVYAPKAIASINPLDPTLNSRCIVIPMETALRPIPDFQAGDKRWADLRDRLYLWAFTHINEVAAIRDAWTEKRHLATPDLRGRTWEISAPLLIMADHVGGDALVTRIHEHLKTYFETSTKSLEDSDRQFTLLKCLPRVLAEKAPHPGGYYDVKDIHDVVSGYLDTDAKDFYKTRTVGRHLLTLNFKDKKVAKGGTQYRLTEDAIRAAMNRRRITPFVEDEEWLAGSKSYTDTRPAAVDPPEPEQPPEDDALSWLSELDPQ